MNHSLLACTLRAEGPQSELRTTKAGLSASARTQYPVELIMVCNSCKKQFSAEVFCAEIKYSWKLGWIYRSAYQWPKQALSKPMGGIDFTKTEFRSLLNTWKKITYKTSMSSLAGISTWWTRCFKYLIFTVFYTVFLQQWKTWSEIAGKETQAKGCSPDHILTWSPFPKFDQLHQVSYTVTSSSVGHHVRVKPCEASNTPRGYVNSQMQLIFPLGIYFHVKVLNYTAIWCDITT